jgi:hypothetical protein
MEVYNGFEKHNVIDTNEKAFHFLDFKVFKGTKKEISVSISIFLREQFSRVRLAACICNYSVFALPSGTKTHC